MKSIITRLRAIGTGLRNNQGMTLMEVMIAVTIMAIIGALVLPNLLDIPKKARVETARNQIKQFEIPLSRYELENGAPPSTQEGLQALVSGGYIKKIPQDPWKNEYQYRSPGQNGDYDIWSWGQDGQEGGEGFDADITNWE